jgi:hypothetical protein
MMSPALRPIFRKLRFQMIDTEVYRLQQRLVDIEGYVALNSNRYSLPVDWIGRRVEVRETKDKIEIQLDARRLVTHRRIAEAEQQRVTLAEHRPPRGQRDARPDPHPEEKAIVTAAPELADYVAGLKQRSRKVVTLASFRVERNVAPACDCARHQFFASTRWPGDQRGEIAHARIHGPAVTPHIMREHGRPYGGA